MPLIEPLLCILIKCDFKKCPCIILFLRKSKAKQTKECDWDINALAHGIQTIQTLNGFSSARERSALAANYLLALFFSSCARSAADHTPRLGLARWWSILSRSARHLCTPPVLLAQALWWRLTPITSIRPPIDPTRSRPLARPITNYNLSKAIPMPPRAALRTDSPKLALVSLPAHKHTDF